LIRRRARFVAALFQDHWRAAAPNTTAKSAEQACSSRECRLGPRCHGVTMPPPHAFCAWIGAASPVQKQNARHLDQRRAQSLPSEGLCGHHRGGRATMQSEAGQIYIA
jgi:hypothetical protein